MRRGVIVRTVINGLAFDGATTDPMQQAVRDALIAFMAATAQAQAEATKEAQRAGIEHAKASAQENKYRGRKPSYSRAQFEAVRDMLNQGTGVGPVAAATGLSRRPSIVSGTMRRAPKRPLRNGECRRGLRAPSRGLCSGGIAPMRIRRSVPKALGLLHQLLCGKPLERLSALLGSVAWVGKPNDRGQADERHRAEQKGVV